MRDMIFKPGDGCGAFSILSLVGRGGTSEIYKAVQSGTHEVVALKCRRLCDISDSYTVEHMLAEADLLSKMDHENVVRIYDVGIDNGVLWMAMELISGVTLRKLIKNVGALSIHAALYYARAIAEGVSALHKRGIIHRDLKPENIMITAENKVKVLDTGAAKISGKGIRQSRHGILSGTPLYISPEHLREETLDARSDVYSLGLTLYEMIAGRHPLRHAGEGKLAHHEVMMRQLCLAPQPLAAAVPGVPRYVSSFVMRAIAKDREMRPATMEEFALSAGSMLITFVEETQSVFAPPELVPGSAKPMRLSDARYDQVSLEDFSDATDDNVPTIDRNATLHGPRSDFSFDAREPAAGEPAQAENPPLIEYDDEMDRRQTLPYRSDHRAASMPDSRLELDGGWSPISMSSPVVTRETHETHRRAGSFKRHLPAPLGAMIIALSITFMLWRPAVLQSRAAVLEAGPLVDVPSLVRHAHRSSLAPASAGESEAPGAITPPANSASADARPGAVVEKTTSLRKETNGWPRWHREAPYRAEPLAGSRHYPDDAPVTSPPATARAYSPTGI